MTYTLPKPADTGTVTNYYTAAQMQEAYRAGQAAPAAPTVQPDPHKAWNDGFKQGRDWGLALEDFWKTHEYGTPPKQPENPHAAMEAQKEQTL